ncbi:sulfate transporter family protein [Methyloligella sp. 2.7D]|uniref:sulfate transporter family protein n=1 Tax=unclassified Methyloligella TaxID=2625955 RepID=UPI00157C04E0|nr:sulfate transporter family protein [Methyloligella sp. GL2]QKP76296.1 sulfate transporter family protein [Methyloligella sp. GL2]
MINAAIQAFHDLFTPPFRSVALRTLFFTIALLALLIAGLEWSFGHFVALPDWIESTIQWLGGLVLVVASMFLIPAVSSLIAGLYLDDIALTVEETHYPQDAPGHEMPVAESVWLAVRFFFVVIGVNILILFLLLVPGINLIAFYLGNGYLLGREFFEMVAMRYMPAKDAKALRQQNGVYVVLCGMIIAAFASVPILNLATPLFATAFMVHAYKRLERKRLAAAPA